MDCSCVYADIDDCSWDFWNQKMVTARKQHKCGECREYIEPGDRYEYLSGVCDGDFTTHKTCADCVSIRDAFFCDGYYFEMVHENLKDHIHDSHGDVSENCLVSLTPKAREIVCGMIEDAWEYWED